MKRFLVMLGLLLVAGPALLAYAEYLRHQGDLRAFSQDEMETDLRNRLRAYPKTL